MKGAIRRAGPGDATAVRTLTRAAYAKWVPLIGREPRPMTADYDAAVRDHLIDMVIEQDAPIALIEMILRPDDLLIENLAVDPAYQGQGLGSSLLAHAERVALEQDRRTIRLFTNGRFADNIALYRRRGYAIELEEPFLGGVAVYMIKALEAAINA